MNIVCTKENLKNHLENALRIIRHNTALPILNNFLIATEKGQLKISSTDLEIGLTSWVPSKVKKEGNITVPAQLLSQFVNNLPNANIELEVKNQKLHLNCGDINAAISGLNSNDFPIIPKIKNSHFLTIDSQILKDSLGSVINSAALSTARPEISSVYFKAEPGMLKFVATDSFRLAHKTLFSSSNELKDKIKIDNSDFHSALIPARTSSEILRISGDKSTNVKVSVDQNQILFDFGDTQLISRLIDGNYPDYEAIIPKSSETRCLLSRRDMEDAVKLSACFSSKLNEVTVKTNGEKSFIEVFSSSDEIGSHKAKINSEIKGGDVEAVFNWRYLLDGLKNISQDQILLEFNGNQKAAVIRPGQGNDFFYILMPIRNN